MVDISLNTEEYVELLRKMIGESEHVQNNPPQFVPNENLIVKHVLDVLGGYSTEKGGPLTIKHVEFKPNRGNLILQYKPASAKRTVAFVGSHMDVVPADASTWERNPFELVVEDDKLYGRGTTDCLGHVALLTLLFKTLAEEKPDLNVSITAVFIASEENNSGPNVGVGVEKLLEEGYLDELKSGPVYWVDSADSQPCIGTAGAIQWSLKATGHLFHSGLPHKGINSIELGSEAMAIIQKRFYEDFAPHPQEEVYKFGTSSSLKPTQVVCSEGSLNQIPAWVEFRGDIRLTPFYNVSECIKKVQSYVDDINADIESVPTRGPASKYKITAPDGKILSGSLELKVDDDPFRGIACNLDSPGFEALDEATSEVRGESKPFSVCGSLPLVADLKDAGFDVQVIGFGLSHVYHGDNEYCLLSDMQKAMTVLSKVITKLN